MKPLLVLLMLTLVLLPLWAYDWPAQDMQVVKSFGQSSGGVVLPGVEVQTLSPSLSAPDDGDVVFVFAPGQHATQNIPSALGGFVALSHADNLRTVTTKVDAGTSASKRTYRRGEPLGQPEVQAGASESRHRIFVFDQQLGELVNPLLVFSAIPDARVPLIYDVKTVPEGQSTPVSLFGQSTLAVGYWDLYVVVSDPITFFPAAGKERGAEGQRGVYAVEAYLNGTEVFNTSLDSVQEKGGRWQVKGMGVFLDEVLTQDQEWKLGQIFLNQGTNILEVVIRDYKGNQTGKTFRVLGVR